MLNTQNFALVGADSLGGFLRWALFIILAITAIILLISKTKIAKKSVGPTMLVLTILAAPFLLITTVEKTVKPEGKTVSSEVNRPDIDIPKTSKDDKEKTRFTTGLPETNVNEKPEPKAAENNSGRGSSNQNSSNNNLTPAEPSTPVEPSNPTEPSTTTQPDNPTQPEDPIIDPVLPTKYHLTINNPEYVAVDVSGDYEKDAEIFVAAIDREDEYYFFEGWVNGENNTVSTTANYTFNMPENDLSLTPTYRFEQPKVTVHFETNDGSNVDDIIINKGQTINQLPSTIKDYYDFLGWFDENNNQLTTETAIDAEITYYARWQIVSHTVTFNTHGGTEIAPLTKDHGETLGEVESTLARYHLIGWFTEENGQGTEYTKDSIVNSDVTLHAYWEINTVTISFNSEKGTTVNPITINEGESITQIPETERAGYIFGGWFTETNGVGEKLTTSITFEDDAIYYAKWTFDTMPIVWQHSGVCEFHNGNAITGDECEKYAGQSYIDTGVQLYNTANFQKDFEIGFEIVEYTPSAQTESQATFFNAKDPTVNTGVIVRRQSNNIEINSNSGKQTTGDASKVYVAYGPVQKVTVIRQGGHVKYSINDEDFAEVEPPQNLDNIAAANLFELTTWFGGYPDKEKPIKNENNVIVSYVAKKFINAKLKNMYIKLEQEEPYDSSDEIVTFNPANPALIGYQNIIDGWKPQITIFNKDSENINNSTWGIDEETFWAGLKSNFESNNCLTPSYEDSAIDTWNKNGTVDCSKPLAYNTGINAALNVYLYDEASSSRGDQVAYTKSSAGTISNMIPNQTYYWEKADDSTVYGYVKAETSNKFRMIDAGSIRNVRDLGGLTASYTNGDTTKSGTVKYEKLFRGERLWKNQSDIDVITNLGVDKEYALVESTSDTWLNDSKLSDVEQQDIIHYNFDYGTANYAVARETVTSIMQDVVAGKNIYFHCRIGSDRTGTVAYLLEGLLGVPDEERYEEYELSHLSGHVDRTRYYKQKPGNTVKFVYMMDYVLTNQDIYDWYMSGTEDEDAGKALIQNFRDAMINYN